MAARVLLLFLGYASLATACSNRQQVFFDDFLGDQLNPAYWKANDNFTHCDPCEDANYLARNVQVANSLLTLTTRRERTTGPHGENLNFTSGWVGTKQTFTCLVLMTRGPHSSPSVSHRSLV